MDRPLISQAMASMVPLSCGVLHTVYTPIVPLNMNVYRGFFVQLSVAFYAVGLTVTAAVGDVRLTIAFVVFFIF